MAELEQRSLANSLRVPPLDIIVVVSNRRCGSPTCSQRIGRVPLRNYCPGIAFRAPEIRARLI